MKIITIAAGFFWIIQGCWAGSLLMPGGTFAADVQTAASQTVDGLVYTMPLGWVMQPVQAGPEVKAHYVFYYGGMPTGEMYLYQESLAGPRPVEQYFQEGLAKVKPILAYYQHLNTQKVNLAGIETIVHEFSYAPAGAMFTARSYVMVVNNSGFNFFFQTASNYYPSMQSVFAQVMASVKAAPRPMPIPAPMPSGGMTVEEMGLVLRLPVGWGLCGKSPAIPEVRLHGLGHGESRGIQGRLRGRHRLDASQGRAGSRCGKELSLGPRLAGVLLKEGCTSPST